MKSEAESQPATHEWLIECQPELDLKEKKPLNVKYIQNEVKVFQELSAYYQRGDNIKLIRYRENLSQ